MKVTIVMTSGIKLEFECKEAEVKRNHSGTGLTMLKLDGIEGQNFLHIQLENIDAVLYER